MHHPPAVQFTVTRSPQYGRSMAWLWCLGLVVSVAFFYLQALSPLRMLVCATTLLVGALMGLWSWRSAPTGILRCDDGVWHWTGFAGDAPCAVVLRMDFQTCLMVSLHQQGADGVWLWLETGPGDIAWMSLRRALVATKRQVLQPMPGLTTDPGQM